MGNWNQTFNLLKGHDCPGCVVCEEGPPSKEKKKVEKGITSWFESEEPIYKSGWDQASDLFKGDGVVKTYKGTGVGGAVVKPFEVDPMEEEKKKKKKSSSKFSRFLKLKPNVGDKQFGPLKRDGGFTPKKINV